MRIFFSNQKVKGFIESLPLVIKTVVSADLDDLATENYKLRMPHSRSLGGGLFELRIVDIQHVRFLYTFHSGHIYLLHGFFKKTNRISRHDLGYARKQLKNLK